MIEHDEIKEAYSWQSTLKCGCLFATTETNAAPAIRKVGDDCSQHAIGQHLSMSQTGFEIYRSEGVTA